jgi:predicted DNA-binding transcriptional regulator AlpA
MPNDPKHHDAVDGGAKPMSAAEMLALFESGALKLMSKTEVFEILPGPVSDASFWAWLKSHHFPPAIELGPPGGRNTTIGWWRHEVLEWLSTRPRRQIGKGAHSYRGRVDGDGKPSPTPRGRPRKQPQRAADASVSP